MHDAGQLGGSIRALAGAWFILVGCASGCRAPATRDHDAALPGLNNSVYPARSARVANSFWDSVVVDSPRGHDASTLVETPSLVETWIVHTRACEQKAGSDPWESITIGRLDESGGPLQGSNPETLLARMTGRPSVVLIHGNRYTYRQSVEEAVRVRAGLEASGGLPPETVFIVFDWPSEPLSLDLIGDLNEKARRSSVAGYHLARLLQTAPAGSRICLMGQSDGGRIALTCIHLLSGAELPAFWSEPALRLTSGRPDLRLRCVILDAATGHHWLNPGERLGHALPTCEALLNLHNSGDLALSVFIFGMYTGLRPAIGRVGLDTRDLEKLGPLADRVEQINLNPWAGGGHTTFPEALEFPDIPRRIALYTSWGDISPGARGSRQPEPNSMTATPADSGVGRTELAIRR